MQGRIQKLLAAAGVASRRNAEDFLRTGRVSVNGRVASLGDVADDQRDRIELDGERLRPARFRYWMLHKPRGVITTTSDPQGRETVVDLVPARERVVPVGRLDRDTEGLVLLTNDGGLAQALLHPSLGNEREYRVVVRGRLGDGKLRRIERGVHLRDGRTAPARTSHVVHDPAADTTRLRLILTEGRKRQIRRSLGALGHPVIELVRVRMGPLRLGSLERGSARPLELEEIERLAQHAAKLRKRAGRS